jgi:hypothetical protein
MSRLFPWLTEPAPPRILWTERVADFCRLLAFLFATLLCLSIPGMSLAPVTPAWRFAVLTAILVGLMAIGLWSMHRGRDGATLQRR